MSGAQGAVAAGFFGKVPSRGDFVRGGLPPGFVRALDGWWQAVIPASRAALGEGAWTEAWMEAPIWRFRLSPGLLGPLAAAGLWLPSTDRVGRLFPLTLAAVAPAWRDLAPLGGFLDAAEAIGLEAVEADPAPEALEAALRRAAAPDGSAGGTAGRMEDPRGAAWWTEGNRLVPPGPRRAAAMPDGAAFAAMLRG